MCRSRRKLSNEYLLAKFGFDTAQNEPDLVFLIFLFSWDLIFPNVSHPRCAAPAPHQAEIRILTLFFAGIARQSSRSKIRKEPSNPCYFGDRMRPWLPTCTHSGSAGRALSTPSTPSVSLSRLSTARAWTRCCTARCFVLQLPEHCSSRCAGSSC